MYRKFWGLQREPFIDFIDQRYSMFNLEQRDIFQEIVKKTVHPGNLIVLKGVSGIGKTHLIKEIELKLKTQGYFVFNGTLPLLDSKDMMEFLHHQIEIQRAEYHGKDSQDEEFDFLQPTHSSIKSTEESPILLLDAVECQNAEEFQIFLENYRRLTFRNGAEASPVISGDISPELLEDWKNHWNFQDCCEFQISPLDCEDVENYIRHRWRRSGGEGDRLSDKIFSSILTLTCGIPRQINHLCMLSLLVGFSEDAEVLTEEIVWKAGRYSSTIENRWRDIKATSSGLVSAEA